MPQPLKKENMNPVRRNPEAKPKPYRRVETVRPQQSQPATNNQSGRPPFQDRNRTPKAFLPRNPDLLITNEMQVTDGKHRGVQLQTTQSPKITVTTRRVREALFNVLGKRIRFARFLDLCAGSGAIGTEAISRGSSLCTFVERSTKMIHFIRLNLKACEISASGHGEIVQMEAVPYLKRMAARRRRWDIVYFDPPHNTDYDEVLTYFSRGACLRKENGILVIEHPAEMFFPQLLGKLKRTRVVREEETALTFYERFS